MLVLYRGQEVPEDVSNASGFTRRLDDTTRGATERFDPWNFGIDGLDEVIRHVRAGFVNLIAARPHVGKRLHEDTPVLTPAGWVAIKDIAVGDDVIGRDGSAYGVTGVFREEDRPLYRITFGDGTTVDADDEHLWTVRKTSRGDKWHDLTTSELVAAGVTDARGKRQFHIPMVEAVEGFAPQVLNDDPYLIGVALGDGYSTQNLDGTVTWRVCTDVESLEAIGATSLKHHESSGYTGYGTVKPRDLKAGRSWEKVVPEAYLFGSKEQRLALLQGLLDTDGYPIPSGGVEFCSTSENLIDSVVFLAQSLGGLCTSRRLASATYTHNGEKRTGRRAERINVKLPADIVPFRLQRKLERWAPPTKYPPTRSIASIERIENGPGVCISVDSPDHLYVVKDFIVTHNTLLALAGIRNNPDRPTLFISADDDPEVVVRKMMQFDGIVADGWKAKPEQMVAYVEENYPNLDIVDNVNWGPVKVNGRLTVSEAIEQYGNEMGQAPELIVYDYLGIDGLDYARTVEISGWQKELCRTLPMPVLILAQASREKSKWEKNQSGDNVRRGFRMEDMMFGGEQQAGLIIGLTRGERLVMGMLQSIIEVDVVKNKAVFDGSGLTNPTDPIILCHHEGRLVDKKTLEARLSAAEDYMREESRRGYFQ